ncbi:LOW QUALITY PROTEIN: hypothetical protein NC653_010153 [Populus alba x Populus x berolinensis]|uniref:UBX domain-containing protein n=1 Tax=Populus alba x Populus x berolinensis TaxID=444605 RepID=A0AAD6QZ66_9ROSI|nr:LOW QUALITY PROTEIN: hypothetical protein NC653_010153 [Populus alba x Populus x berolinensis]
MHLGRFQEHPDNSISRVWMTMGFIYRAHFFLLDSVAVEKKHLIQSLKTRPVDWVLTRESFMVLECCVIMICSSKILQKVMMWMQFSIKLDNLEPLEVLWRILINLQVEEALLELVEYYSPKVDFCFGVGDICFQHSAVFEKNSKHSIRKSECPKELEPADRRLADGTRMVAHFNNSRTVNDIGSSIDASRPGGARNYQLQLMGFPPKLLTYPTLRK